MPLFYVNPRKGARKGKRVQGRARVRIGRKARRKKSGSVTRRARRIRKAVFGRKKRRARRKRSNSVMAKKRKGGRRRRRSKKVAHRRKRRGSKKRRRRARRSKSKRRRGRRRKRRASGKSRRRRRRAKSSRRRSRRRRRKSSRRRSRRRRKRRASRTRRMRRSEVVAMRAAHGYGPTGTKRYGMASNPGRRRRRRRKGGARRRGRLARRYRRKYRRNPGMPGGGAVKMLVGLVKRAVPVFAGVVGGRLVISKIAPRIPFLDMIPAMARGPLLSAAMPLGYVFLAKKVSFLRKHQTEVLVGLGLNFLGSLIESFAPAEVKSWLGLGDGIYDRALGEYVELADYLQTDGTPIDDDIALSDYVSVGALEQELGALGDGLQQELGLEQELGNIGGVSTGAMLAPVPSRSFTAPVPTRSFTSPVPHAGAGFDNPGGLYTGIFGGGF